jgi:hypothetical protein
MVKRYIYAFDTAGAARGAVNMLRGHGVSDEAISLVARSSIELEEIPSRYLDASTDFIPALRRGAAIGGVIGLCAGLVALAIPTLGITLAGPALIGFFAGGAVLGAWSSALVGSSVPDEVRRKFEDEIKAGRTLLVVDSNDHNDLLIMETMSEGVDRHLLWQSKLTVPDGSGRPLP